MKYAHLENQWNKMLASSTIPCFEFKLPPGEYLLVEISFRNNGLLFNFDENGLKTRFSGNVVKSEGGYKIKFDACFDNLDYYLQEIYAEVMEGFIIPNDIYIEE